MARGRGVSGRRLGVEPLEQRCLLAVSSLLWPGVDGHLIYRPDARGDRIPDFSDVGYEAGREAIPDIPVAVTISPVAGDDTATIQAAVNQVAAMPLDANGFRGTVLLQAGHYDIDTQVVISSSGIVLRGEGRGTDGTVLHARGDDRRALIRIDGSGSMQMLGSAKSMTDFTVPVGARTFHVSDMSGLGVGDSILITRPSTAEWIHDIGMDLLAEPWQPGSKDLKYERVITRIEGNAITVDIPLVNSFEQQYGGGTVQAFSYGGRIENVGVENLRGESDFDFDTDEDHSWNFVEINRTENAWVRHTTAQYFAYAHVSILRDAKRITVSDAVNLDPKSIITGGRRYAFNVIGQQNLVTGCVSYDGRHDYVLHSVVAGPNVFHDSVAIDANNDTGPHHRWATGALFDNVVSDGEMNSENRWNWGTGHGWAGANMVFYNCDAQGYRVQNPPTAQNWVIGSTGQIRSGHFDYTLGALPGTYDSHGTPVVPDSLYEAQLAERTAYDSLDYREYWLGDIDGFTDNDDSTVDDVYVDPAWAAAIPGTTTGFDDQTNDRWVPFSFDVNLVASDQLVDATLALGMQNTGGSSDDDRIYLESTSDSLLLSDLGWSVSNSEERGYVLDLGDRLDLLADGVLNLAIAGDTAIDWAVLNLQVVPGESVTYVDDDFAGNVGDPIADADAGTSGAQPAVFGVNAFSTIGEAAAATSSVGSIVVNSGTYTEDVTLLASQTLRVAGPDAPQTVTVDSLSGAAATTLHLEGSLHFAEPGASSVGRMNVRSNRAEAVTITIPTGHDFVVAGDVSVGIPGTTGAVTNLTVTGGGGWSIVHPAATVEFGLANSDQNSTENSTTIDLSGLGSFAADLDSFRVGYGSRIRSTVLLSDAANSITANVLSVSNSANSNARPGILTLGSGTNTIHADRIEAGVAKGHGTIAFASQLPGSPGTIEIRGRAGGSTAADIALSYDDSVATGVSPVGVLDLRGHAADVVADTLTIAYRTIGGSGGANGTLSFDTGTFSVKSIDMATKSGGDATSWATVNIGGGAFTVSLGGSFQLANQSGGGTANSKLNITGGVLISNADIVDGGGTATTNVKIDGGAVDLAGHNLGGVTPIDTLSFYRGGLQNVGQINNGATGLAKTTGGTLVVGGTNTYTGATTVGDGVLQVDGSVTSNVAVGSGGTLHGSGTIVGDVSGTGSFSPGNSPGRMTIHGDFTPAGIVGFELNSPFVAGMDYDQYVVSGTVDLSGAALVITTNTPGITALPQVTLIANESLGSTIASNDPAEGAEVTVGSATGKLFYNGGDGNDVVLEGPVSPIVYVDGGPGADVFEFTAGSVGGAWHLMSVNGAVESYDPALVDTFYIDGGGGDDRLIVHGTAGDEQAMMAPGSIDMTGPGYAVHGSAIATIDVDAGQSGADEVSMTGSTGTNRLYSYADRSVLCDSSRSFEHQATGFDKVSVAVLGSGRDYAFLYDGPENDVLHATPDRVELATHDRSSVRSASGFQRVYAYSTGGGTDNAALAGSDTASNRFYSYQDYAILTESRRSFYFYARGFDEVAGESPGSEPGYAYLYDSPGDDWLRATPTSAAMDRAAPWSNATAAGFARVYAYATCGGSDRVELTGNGAGGNQFRGYPAYSTLTDSVRSFYHYVRGFRSVTATGSQSDPSSDRAYLYDSPGDDTLVGRGASAVLRDRADTTYSIEALYFDLVYARSTDSDTNDTADVDDSVVYDLIRSGTW